MANGYIKIAGGARTGRLALGNNTLWRGPDHLLLIERDGYTENYKRFRFADIESVTIRQTKSYQVISIILVILVALFTWAVIVNTGVGRYVTLFWLVIFAIPLVVNLALGQTCATHLSTAVQQEQLPLGRVRKATKVLEALKVEIAATQGLLAPDVARVQFQLRNLPPEIAPPPIPLAGGSELPPILPEAESPPAEPPAIPPPIA